MGAGFHFNLRDMPKSKVANLICFAVAQEAAPFRSFAKRRDDLCVWVVGMGRSNAERSFLEALDAVDPGRVITSGFAGGLDPNLSTGDVLFDADEEFVLSAELERVCFRRGQFHCHDRIATTPEEKAALRESTGADAVEMESGVIREICADRGIPSATVRVISDAADESLPLDFNRLMKPDMSLSAGKLAGALLRSPGKIVELIRFQKRIKQAGNNLARILSEALAVGAEK